MKIHLVCYEDPDSWICGKIAKRLAENINNLGHSCVLGRAPDETADINHHVIYMNYPGHATGTHTLMVTHIDDALKLGKLTKGLLTARAAVCMSAESVSRLASLGLDSGKLAFVNPAQDGAALPRRFVIGITTRLYPDGRKREDDLVKLSAGLSPQDFAFKIMGFGWISIVADLREKGFEVEYHQDFNYEKYLGLIAALDYFLYMSGDEGSMGYIDALAAGVKTIVQPQGFHLDAKNGITHAFSSLEELKAVFAAIASEKKRRQEAVKSWTWENYARQHLLIWEQCLENRALQNGLSEVPTPVGNSFKLRSRLWANAFLGRARTVLNLGKDFECDSRLWQKRHDKKHRKP